MSSRHQRCFTGVQLVSKTDKGPTVQDRLFLLVLVLGGKCSRGGGLGSPRTGRELPFVIGTQNEACLAPGTRASDAFGEHGKKSNQGRRQAKSSEIKSRASSGTGSPPPAIHPAARVAVWLAGTPKARFLPPETHRAAELAGHARERTQLEALTLGFSQAPAP